MIAPHSTRLRAHAHHRRPSRPQKQRVLSQTTSPQLNPRRQIRPRRRVLDQVERIPQRAPEAVPAPLRPRIRPRRNQQLERRPVHPEHREVERTQPVVRLRLDVRACRQQHLQHRGVPGDGREVDRLHLVVATDHQVRERRGPACDIGASSNDRRDDDRVRITHARGDVQRGILAVRARSHVRSRVEEELHDLLELPCVAAVGAAVARVVPPRLHQRCVQRREAHRVVPVRERRVVEHPAAGVVAGFDARAVAQQKRYRARAAEADRVDQRGFLELGVPGRDFVRVDADLQHVQDGALHAGRDEVLQRRVVAVADVYFCGVPGGEDAEQVGELARGVDQGEHGKGVQAGGDFDHQLGGEGCQGEYAGRGGRGHGGVCGWRSRGGLSGG